MIEEQLEYQREWRKRNPEKSQEYTKRFREKNPEYARKVSKEYYRKNPEACKARGAKWRKKNPEKIKEYQKKYREDNRESINAASLVYGRDHKEQRNAYQSKRNAKLKANKERVVDWVETKYGGIPCMDCDGVFAWCSMDFDHRPGEVKELKIGSVGCRKATSKIIARVEKEIAKCDLVCSNCHRVRTQDRHAKPQG